MSNNQEERWEGRRVLTCPGPPAAPRLGLGVGLGALGSADLFCSRSPSASGSICSLRQINGVCFSTSITFRLALGPFEFP